MTKIGYLSNENLKKLQEALTSIINLAANPMMKTEGTPVRYR